MRKTDTLSLVLMFLLPIIFFCSCGNTAHDQDSKQSLLPIKEINEADVLQVFDSLKTDSRFVRSLLQSRDLELLSISPDTESILFGDINRDGEMDALMPFSIEYEQDNEVRQGLYYFILFQVDGQLKWQTNLNRTDFLYGFFSSGHFLTIEKIDDEYLRGFASETSFSTRKPILLEFDSVLELFNYVDLFTYFWDFKELKINGNLPLNTSQKKLVKLLGKPDSISDFFSDCNYNNGPKKIYHYGDLSLFFNNRKLLENESYRFDTNLDFSIEYRDIKLNGNTTYSEILKLSPEILKQQPPYLNDFEGDDEEDVNDPTYKKIYIPLHQKIVNIEYYGTNWVILAFRQDRLIKLTIPTGDCGI